MTGVSNVCQMKGKNNSLTPDITLEFVTNFASDNDHEHRSKGRITACRLHLCILGKQNERQTNSVSLRTLEGRTLIVTVKRNIYRLCKSVAAKDPDSLAQCTVVFISNLTRLCKVHTTSAHMKAERRPVIWVNKITMYAFGEDCVHIRGWWDSAGGAHDWRVRASSTFTINSSIWI